MTVPATAPYVLSNIPANTNIVDADGLMGNFDPLYAAFPVQSADIDDSAIATSKIADGAVTDAKLASPNNTVYRTVATGKIGWVPSQPAGSYYTSPGAGQTSTGSGALDADLVPVKATRLAVAGKTTKLCLRIAAAINNVGIGSMVAEWGLYPVASGGTGGTVVLTFGTRVAASVVQFTNADINSTKDRDSGDFTVPADGMYVVGLTFTGASPPANSAALGRWFLEARYV